MAREVTRSRQPTQTRSNHANLHEAMLTCARRLCNVGTVATMTGRLGALATVLVGAFACVLVLAAPAAASHDDNELQVIVALNAAGGDRITVYDATSDTYEGLASEVAEALDQAPGSFRASEDLHGGSIRPNDKLARPDGRGGFTYTLDTGKLQVLAQGQGYDAVIVVLCTPKLHQVVDALRAPQAAPYASPGSRCRGWYQPPDEPTIRAVVQLLPDRQRYPAAVLRVAGAAAISFGLVGLGATFLRRGPLKRRSVWSWLLAAAAVVTIPLTWGAVTLAFWLSGAAADPVLLGGGGAGEQVARTLLPGLAFLAPALLPAVILLSAARKERPPPADRYGTVAPPVPMWWPTPWWQQWAAAGGAPAAPGPAAPPPPGPSGWAPPGADVVDGR